MRAWLITSMAAGALTALSGGAAAQECDVLSQAGCRPGEKCTLTAEGVACAPDGTVASGGACISVGGLDDCVGGTYCVDGVCEPVCDPARPDFCSGWSTCMAVEGGGFGICRPAEGCDVLSQAGCGPGEKCTLTAEGVACAPDGTVASGGACISVGGLDDCVGGTYCVGGVCQPVCDPARPAACRGTEICSDLGGGDLGVCVSGGPPGVTCQGPQDCDPGTYCARDRTCHPDGHRPLGGQTCPEEPTLWSFKSGRVCTRPDGTQEVCEEAVDIDVDGSQQCEFDHRTVRCNWFGWEFDYAGFDPTVPVRCEWVRSMPADEGNRDGVRQGNATTGASEVFLPAASGHFISPGFQNHTTPPGGAQVVVAVRFDCTYAGSPLFAVDYRFHFHP